MKVIEYKNKKLKLPYDLSTAGETSTETGNKTEPTQRPINPIAGIRGGYI